MEQLPRSNPLFPYVSVDPRRLGGEPVFRGTRVPVRSLFDHLEAGDSLETFLDHFEGVTRGQAKAVLAAGERGKSQP
jgi:uncharacterized protein (DUF433 family)